MNEIRTFSGFPEESLQFLKDLADNNNRGWFEAHKKEYQVYLLEPAQAFVIALGMKLQKISPAIRYDTRTNGSGTLLRIYRDTRFSKHKAPYKTNISGIFWESSGKKTESPGFGFQLEASGMGLMAGIFGFPKHVLQVYRDAVIDEQLGAELEAAVEAVAQAGEYKIAGEHYKRVPNGYDPNHRRAKLLRYNALYAYPSFIEPHLVTTPGLVDICFEHFRKMAPIQQWLAKVVRRTDT